MVLFLSYFSMSAFFCYIAHFHVNTARSPHNSMFSSSHLLIENSAACFSLFGGSHCMCFLSVPSSTGLKLNYFLVSFHLLLLIAIQQSPHCPPLSCGRLKEVIHVLSAVAILQHEGKLSCHHGFCLHCLF